MKDLIKDLKKLANPEKAKLLQGFFKTKKGEYGEGDVFLGVVVPEQRKIAKKYIHLSLREVESLLHSKIHEHRMTALIIWTYQFENADEKTREKLGEEIYKMAENNKEWQ